MKSVRDKLIETGLNGPEVRERLRMERSLRTRNDRPERVSLKNLPPNFVAERLEKFLDVSLLIPQKRNCFEVCYDNSVWITKDRPLRYHRLAAFIRAHAAGLI